MARITVEDCVDKFESRFELVLVASNRARKLHSGETPTIDKDNDKNTVIALREIADETIDIDDMKKSLIEEYQTVSSQTEEDLSLEYSDLENEKINQEDTDTIYQNQEDVNSDNIQENSISEDEIINDDSIVPQDNNERNLENHEEFNNIHKSEENSVSDDEIINDDSIPPQDNNEGNLENHEEDKN